MSAVVETLGVAGSDRLENIAEPRADGDEVLVSAFALSRILPV